MDSQGCIGRRRGPHNEIQVKTQFDREAAAAAKAAAAAAADVARASQEMLISKTEGAL